MPTNVSARGFSGGHSSGGFHSSRGGGGRSFRSPSRGGFHSTPKAPKSRSNNGFHKSPVTPAPKPPTSTPKSPDTKSKKYVYRGGSNNNKRQGIGSEFGHSIVRGAGWSIGSNMGNSLWHTMFGFGNSNYVDHNGQTQQQSRGFFGWIILIILAVIAFFIIKKILKNKNK